MPRGNKRRATAGTLPAIYASEAWSCDLNVEELKVKSNPIAPQLYDLNRGRICT